MSKANQIPEIYQEAIRRFEEITDKKLDDQDLRKLTTVDALMKEIDRRNESFTEFREKRHTFFSVLQGAMRPVELVGDLAAGAASMAFPPSTLVFGAAAYLINASKGVSGSYDAIQSLMGELKDFTERLKNYNREDISPELSNKLSQILATLIEIFALSRKVIKRGRFVKFVRNVALGNDDDVQAAVATLNGLTKSEGQLVIAEMAPEVKRVGRGVDSIALNLNAGFGEMRAAFEGLKSDAENAKSAAKEEKDKTQMDAAKRILQPSKSAQVKYDELRKHHEPGTGDWIKEELAFKQWVDGESLPLLWISGIPGSGKSYLATSIITNLKQQYPQSTSDEDPLHVSVAYFYFKDDNPKTRSFHQALRDIAFQICQADPVFLNHVATQCDSQEDTNSIRTAWRSLFLDYFVDNDKVDSVVYVILDGVDEAFSSERQTFLEFTKDLTSNPDGSRLRLAMVGRPQLTNEITEAFEAEVPTIIVNSNKNSDDIEHYIRASIARSPTLKRLSSRHRELEQEIVEKLTSGAQGMFMWVNLMLKELVKKASPAAIHKALDEAPKGLSQMLRHVLEGFSSSLTDDSPMFLNELLTWVTVASTSAPLKLGELDAVCKLKSEDGEGVIYLEGILRIQFASFFNVTREDEQSTADLQIRSHTSEQLDSDIEEQDTPDAEGFYDVENSTDFQSSPLTTEVTFCHASIGDFFRSSKEQSFISAGEELPQIGVDYAKAKAHVLISCLSLFNDEAQREKIKDCQPSLLTYAAVNWRSHLADLDFSETLQSDKEAIAKHLIDMIESPNALRTWAWNINYEFFKAEILDSITRWTHSAEVQDSLDEGQKSIIERTSEHKIIFFRPVAEHCARSWLVEAYWNAAPCSWILACYIRLETHTSDEPLPPWVGFEEATGVVEAAEWAGFEKTALWHRRVAMSLRDLGFSDLAVIHFEKTLELEANSWLARSGLAIVRTHQADWKECIRLDQITIADMKKLMADSPDTTTNLHAPMHLTLERLHSSHLEIGEIEAAFQYRQEALEHDKACHDCLYYVIEYLSKQDRPQEIIDLLKKLNKETPPASDTPLIRALTKNIDEPEDYVDMVIKAAAATNEIKFVVDAYRATRKAAKRDLKPISASCADLVLSQIYWTYTGERAKAVRIWERLLRMYSSSRDDTEVGWVKNRAALHLSSYLLDLALECGIGSPEAEHHIERIEKMATSQVRVGRSTKTVISTNPPSIMLGAWYRANGRMEEARACFKMHIKEALQILSDDDPENDGEGFFKLLIVLNAAQDDRMFLSLIQGLEGYIQYLGAIALDSSDDDDDDDENEETSSNKDGADTKLEEKQPTEDAVGNEVDPEQNNDTDAEKDEINRQGVISAKVGASESITETSHTEDNDTTESNDGAQQDNDLSAPKAKEPGDSNTKDVAEETTTDETSQENEDDSDEENVVTEIYGLTAEAECDGPCHRTLPSYAEFYVCRYCYGVGFCKDCMPIRKEGKMPEQKCSPNHQWFFIPKAEKEVEPGMFLLDSELHSFDEMKQILRKEWGMA